MSTVFYFLSSAGWFVASLFLIDVIFNVTDTLGDWSRGDAFLIYAIHNLSYSFTVTFIWSSVFWKFNRAVQEGKLDQLLLKPLNLRFTTTTGVFDLTGVLHLIPTIGLFIYVFSIESYDISIASIIAFIVLFLIGEFIVYNLICILFYFTFWTISAKNFGTIFWILQGKTKMPLDIFPYWLQGIFLFLLPISFIVFIPFQAIVGVLEPIYAVYASGIAIVTWSISQWMLKAGLKRYEGVSS